MKKLKHIFFALLFLTCNVSAQDATVIDAGKTAWVVDGGKTATIIKFSPLAYDPILALSNRRLSGFAIGNPIMKLRRVVEGDEIDIYEFNVDNPRQYRTSLSGAFVTDEAKLYPKETFFLVTVYDQSGNGNDATQTTAARQPEVTWAGATFGAELVTNGDFANWTGDDPDNWPVINEDGTNYVTENPAGSAQMVSDNTAVLQFSQSITTGSGKNFRISFDTSSVTAGWRFTFASLPYTNYTSEGSREFYTYSDSATDPAAFVRYSSSASDVTYDNISIKEVLTWEGLPQINFDGVNDLMLLTGMTNPASDYTFILRLQQPDPNLSNKMIFDIQTGRLFAMYPQAANTIAYFDTNYRTAPLAITTMFNASYVLDAPSSGAIYNDKTAIGSSLSYTQRAIGGNVAIGSVHGGTANWFRGKINSLYIYNTVLTVPNIESINDFLDN